MRKACGLLLGAALLLGTLAQTRVAVSAQTIDGTLLHLLHRQASKAPRDAQLPAVDQGVFNTLVRPILPTGFLPPPLLLAGDTANLLESAITKRLGIRYRFYGIDDTGYDCSGFVWRVFRDAGADFQRVAARTLWHDLPAATEAETQQFGTLVFFNGLKHIGIVRDAYTFYHASRSQGVTLSSFSGYWGSRITGYRRAPKPLAPPPPGEVRNGD